MLGTALSHGIKPQQQRNLGSPIASFKACPEKFYWVKRKAAVHGTKVTETRSQKLWLWSGNQNPKGPLLSWQGRLMKRGDKDQFRDEAPWNPVGFSQRNPLSHVWRLGLHKVCPLLMFVSLAYKFTSLSGPPWVPPTHHAPSYHRTFVHDGLIFTKLAHAHLLTNLNSTISSSAKPSFIP